MAGYVRQQQFLFLMLPLFNQSLIQSILPTSTTSTFILSWIIDVNSLAAPLLLSCFSFFRLAYFCLFACSIVHFVLLLIIAT
jgi:hypothetical protein